MADILENPVDLIDDAYEQEIQVEQEMIEVVAYRSYNRLDDKPQINGVELVGNKTSSDLGITAQIESAVNSEAQARAQADNTLQGKIDTEKLARQQADSTLQGNIDAEETARKAADKDIQDVLDGETLARQNADTALGGRIDTEIHNRQVADIGLQGQIDAITSKSDVVDVVATYADLQAYDTQHLGDNDVIKVLDDETHEDALTYYRWSTTAQTWTYIGQEAPYYSKSQTDTLLLGKQNTIDSSHKLSADLVTDTSTTNKFVTAQDITNWNAKQDALTAGTGIDITSGIISTPAIVPEVVTELPTTGAEGKLYLTPKAHTTQTATGNPIEATVTEQAGQLESFQLDGDTFQQTYTGVNLFNKSLPSSNTYYTSTGATATYSKAQFINYEVVPSSDKITMSYSAVHNQQHGSDISAYVRIVQYNSSNSFISRLMSADNNFTFTLDSNTAKVIICVDSGEDAYFDDLQLQYGSTATSYEPFVGGQPSPSPEYPQPIQTVTGRQVVNVTGKNRLRQIDGTYSRNGITATVNKGKITLNGTAIATAYIPLAAPSDYYSLDLSGAYTLSATRIPGVSYTIYHGSASVLYSTSSSQTKTLGGTYDGVRFQINVAQGTTLNNVVVETQLEKGSATTYEPYSKQTYPINLGSIELCKLGTYQDYIWKDGESWKVHKATATITLSGESSENWYIDQYAYMLNSVISAKPFSDIANIEAYCKSFSKSATGQTSSYAVSFWYNATGTGVRFIKDQTPDLSSFRSWLANNNQTVYYPLATATDTTITDQTLIAQLEAIRTASLQNGANTITNTATGTNLAGDMEIGYYGFEPRNRYDKWLWLDINNEYEQIGS